MRVQYSARAFADRERILDYLRKRSPGGAKNVAAGILDAVAQLCDQPNSGHRTQRQDVRVLIVVRYPYKIFYRVHDDLVEILHIRHAKRRAINR